MALTTYLDLVLRGTITNPLDLVTGQGAFNHNKGDSLSDGTGAVDTADMYWSDTRTLNATTENIDLYGSLSNVFGATQNFARAKGFLIHNKSTTAGHTLTIGGAASNAVAWFSDTSDKWPIGPNGIFFFWEPSAVGKAIASGTADILKVETSHNFSYDIILIGASA